MTTQPLDTPQTSIDTHKFSDLGQGPDAQHHKLGDGPDDAAPGNHKHTSSSITDFDSAVTDLIPSSALSYHSGELAANVSGIGGAGAYADAFTTDTLEVGTWLVTIGSLVIPSSSSGTANFKVVVGSATATLSGKLSDSNNGDNYINLSFSFIADVTVEGTLKLQCKTNIGSLTVNAASSDGVAGATAYTAVKVA